MHSVESDVHPVSSQVPGLTPEVREQQSNSERTRSVPPGMQAQWPPRHASDSH